MITLEEMIISRGDIERIYRSDISLTLWRAVNKSNKQLTNPLYPDLNKRILPNGRIRLADVATYFNDDGILFVKSEESRGTSLSDKEGLFGHKSWEYIFIPAGTNIPPELIITKDHHIPKKNCWHYSISPNYDMPVTKFLKSLDQLAINAKIKIGVTRNAQR